VGLTQSKELTYSKETLDATTDDNPDWANYIGGRKEAEFTAEALYDYSQNGFDYLWQAFLSDDAVQMELAGPETGDPKIEFDGHVTELSRSFETNELNTYSVTVAVEDKPTESTVS
jgi:predicted secreted protein